MFQIQNLIKFSLVNIFLLISYLVEAQFATSVVDYLPAPGQYTNADFIGTPQAANSLIGTNSGNISLGAFGGSVTLYFAQGIQNVPSNPYGVDFTIYGNATSTWSEPGIIQVMKDENRNGIPDDNWYEIAGSEHFWDSTIKDYEVTYENNSLSKAGDIHWTDNLGASGIIPENSFHLQPYYPKTDLFPQINSENYTLHGTRLKGQIDLSNPGSVISHRRAFGYADNTPVLSLSLKLPDNPYTPEIEGSGGDAIDIDWAIAKDGNHVYLDEIHFVRIYTGMNALVGWLGEVSTEIRGIRDVEPAIVAGSQSMIVIQDMKQKIQVGEELEMHALFFENGIMKDDESLVWSVSNPDLVKIEDGKLKAEKVGKFNLRATLLNSQNVFAEIEIEVFSVGKAEILLQQNNLKVNDKIRLSGKIIDQNDKIISGITPVWRFTDQSVGSVIVLDGLSYLTGNQPGKGWLFLETSEDKTISDSIQIVVYPESELKKVYITVKTSERTLIPRQSFWVEQLDLTANVDRSQKLYGLAEIGFVSLAHAISAALKANGINNEWAFRDDAEGGSELYLWKVPEIEEGSIVNHYGYGGSRTSEAFRKTWVVMLNQEQYVSGFDKIRVNNDDEIMMYQILDNSIPWQVTHLTSGVDSVNVAQTIKIQINKYDCKMNDNRSISINSSEVIPNQLVEVVPVNQLNSNQSFVSDELGQVYFTSDEKGDFSISSGIDESKLFVKSAIIDKNKEINKEINNLNCLILPNPFIDKIRIICSSPINSIKIFNLAGAQVFNQYQSNSEFNLQALITGVYIIQISAENQTFVGKIVKQ